jgi:hypothetical protein
LYGRPLAQVKSAADGARRSPLPISRRPPRALRLSPRIRSSPLRLTCRRRCGRSIHDRRGREGPKELLRSADARAGRADAGASIAGIVCPLIFGLVQPPRARPAPSSPHATRGILDCLHPGRDMIAPESPTSISQPPSGAGRPAAKDTMDRTPVIGGECTGRPAGSDDRKPGPTCGDRGRPPFAAMIRR